MTDLTRERIEELRRKPSPGGCMGVNEAFALLDMAERALDDEEPPEYFVTQKDVQRMLDERDHRIKREAAAMALRAWCEESESCLGAPTDFAFRVRKRADELEGKP